MFRVAACFGDLTLYGDYKEIDPKAAKNPLITFTSETFSKTHGYEGAGYIYGLVTAKNVTSEFYDEATGAFEVYCLNDPKYSEKIPQLKTGITTSINLNDHKARISFPLKNDEGYDYQVYTRSFNKASFKPKTDNPPTHFFNSACSAQLWLNRDKEAEKISFSSKTGTVTVTGISKVNTTVATIVYGVDAKSPHVYLTSIALNGSSKVGPLIFLTLVVLFFTILF